MATTPIATALSEARGDTAGFTLIELLVVLSIMSLLAAVAMQAIERRPDAFGRDKAAMAVSAAIADAQEEASRSGSPAMVQLATLGLSGLRVEPTVGVATDHILLFPDRSSTGGVVLRGARPLVRVDWLTAQVRDAR